MICLTCKKHRKGKFCEFCGSAVRDETKFIHPCTCGQNINPFHAYCTNCAKRITLDYLISLAEQDDEDRGSKNWKKKQLTIPHPEEKPDYFQAIGILDLSLAITEWLVSYHVPTEYWDYWRTKIDIEIDPTIVYPAEVHEENGIRHMVIRPEWLNAGVIAHEQAHNSYALLSDIDKQFFSAAYIPLKTTDPLIKLLYKTNTYGLTNDVEGHAELYRYLAGSMPEILKQYYPRLF